MAAVEEPRCRGCGTPVPSGSTGRRLLTGLSSNQMLSAWKDLLREKLDTLNVFVSEEVSKSGYVCRKCFRSFQSFSDMKHKLLESIGEAVKYMTTIHKESSEVETETEAAVQLGKRQSHPPPCEPSVAAKRPRTEYNLPPTTSSSPNVQVSCMIIVSLSHCVVRS